MSETFEVSAEIVHDVELKKPAICALSICGKEIPEGHAGQFMLRKNEYEYTHDNHTNGYIRELIQKGKPIACLGTVNLKYI